MPAPGHTNGTWNSIINTVTCQRVKSVSCPLVVLFLGIHSPVILAEIYDITELQQPDTSSPAMAGFYSVTPDGETTLEDPLESGFATSAGSDFDPERPAEEEAGSDSAEKKSVTASDNKKESRETRTVRIRVKRKAPRRDLASRFQCERHGFYYTNDGRCILPTFGHSPVLPQPSPESGMHHPDAKIKVKSSNSMNY